MFKHIFCPFCLLVCLFCCRANLSAEIVSVTITWNKGLCDEGCERLLKRRLEGIDAVARVEVIPGQAVMYWKPGQKFDYLMVRRPTQRVGIGIEAFYVTVRGTVRKAGDKVTLTSLGDNTKFELTSAPAPRLGTYTAYSSPKLYQLRAEQLEAFQRAESDDAMVTATGFLLMPYRRQLTIVLENYQIEKEPDQPIQ